MQVGHFTPPTIQTKVNNASTGVQRTGSADRVGIEALEKEIANLSEQIAKLETENPNASFILRLKEQLRTAQIRLQQLQALDTLHDQLDKLLEKKSGCYSD